MKSTIRYLIQYGNKTYHDFSIYNTQSDNKTYHDFPIHNTQYDNKTDDTKSQKKNDCLREITVISC